MERKSSALHIIQKDFPHVTSVTDATKSVAIEVTPTDTKSSTRKDRNTCAMAVACKRAMNLDGVMISRTIAYLIRGRKAVRYKLPLSVQKEIVSFDRNGKFLPGMYALSKPDHKLGNVPGGNVRENKGIRKARPVVRHYTDDIRVVLFGKQTN